MSFVVLLSHPPGHAQADFGEATVVIGGVEQKARFFTLVLWIALSTFIRRKLWQYALS
jgi:hypothetical protein